MPKKIIFLSLFATLFTTNLYAKNHYDNLETNCKNKSVELKITSSSGIFFGSRLISVIKGGQLFLEESYTEKLFPYQERYGSTYPKEFSNIVSFARKLKPNSVHSEIDYIFRASDEATIFQSYDPLNPAYGGEYPAIFLELKNSREFYVFDIKTQCSIKALAN